MLSKRLTILLINFIVNSVFCINNNYSQEDLGFEIGDLLNKYGYPFENHTVTTEDGYILQIHRIPYGKQSTIKTNRPAILLAHGLLASSIQWLHGGVDKDLPYYLVEKGYDVWMPNARGNTYSRKHINIDPNKNRKQFYDFSWNEIGYYDWPVVIDYIINVTKQEKIFYIGHSQGCVTFFVMLSERPEYNEKIRLMVSLAPVVYTKGIKSLGFVIPARYQNTFEQLAEFLNISEFLPLTKYNTRVANRVCNKQSRLQWLCISVIGLNGGFNSDKVNKTRLPLILSHFPAGASIKQLFHYTQILNSDIFRKYDFGETKNIEKYGQITPPLYNLENVKVPVAIYYGDNDWITTERNILKLASELPNVVYIKKVDDKQFTHFDFIFSVHAVDILYPDIINQLSLY